MASSSSSSSIDLFVADHPVGVESRVQEVIRPLYSRKSAGPLLLGICGEGGIGKTTIAKATYNKIHHQFEAKSFLLNVSEVWEQNNGEISLQQQLLSVIRSSSRRITINTVESGKRILQERLPHWKILLVLDNVTTQDQLDALCISRRWFGQGSIIIITTRDRDLLLRLEVEHIYTMNVMDDSESLELFSWYAFKQTIPRKGFANHSRCIVEYCRGIPLVLEIIGSFLYTTPSKGAWVEVEQKLVNIPSTEGITKILKISIDGLSDNDVRQIFFDIALNLFGMDYDEVIQILNDSRHSAENGIQVLVRRRLVTVDSKNKIKMHGLVQDCVREITRENSKGMPEKRQYDVFLSYRGEDSRGRFISHLFTALQNARINVFRDDIRIQPGEKILVSLSEAIGQSRIYIVVLSSNYANSRWCMLELEEIMECRRRGLVVIPVFYEVDPSDVRNQRGSFGVGFESLVSKIAMPKDRRMNLITLLNEIGGLAGFVFIKSRNASENIKKIVDNVTDLLDRRDLFVVDHPVGVESRVQDDIQLFNSQESKDPLMLGICGIEGIGKTTIAQAVYNKIRHGFEAKSFLLDVRGRWEQDNGKVSLQQQLLFDIYKTTKIKIDTVESGKVILQERLRQKRIFAVLDGVNKLDQLNALCESRKWFGQGSRVIITTRDENLLNKLRLTVCIE